MTDRFATYTTQNGTTPQTKHAAYRKMVLGALQFLAGFYEMMTGREAPKPGDILRG